jgi:transcriptional antiterminator RfaH
MLGRVSGWTTCAVDDSSWIVVNTYAHKELIAIENLERQQYASYFPMIRTRVRHARRSRDVLRPLFPDYLFVSVDPEHERWRPILSTLGVRSRLSGSILVDRAHGADSSVF